MLDRGRYLEGNMRTLVRHYSVELHACRGFCTIRHGVILAPMKGAVTHVPDCMTIGIIIVDGKCRLEILIIINKSVIPVPLLSFVM